MSNHVLSALFGLLGGLLPGSIRFAWKTRHGKHTRSGTIDLTYRKKL
jgi:hypothetical protein